MKRIVSSVALVLMFAAVIPGHPQDAAGLYKTNCAPCHGATGDANTPAGKNFKATVFNTSTGLTKSDGELLEIAKKGKGQMPPWSDVLTDAQLKSVIEYIRTLQKK